MSGEVWVVRAGQKAKYVDEFLAGGYVAVGFGDVTSDDLSGSNEAAVRALASDASQRTAAGQLATVAFRITAGDYVLVPRLTKAHRDYLVGTVTGDYRYATAPVPPSGRHQRAVTWIGAIDHSSLSLAATNTLGAILTVFRPTAVLPELRNLMTALSPISGTSTSAASTANPGSSAPTPGNPGTPATPTGPPANAPIALAVSSLGFAAPGLANAAPLPAASAAAASAGTFEYSSAELDVRLDQDGRARILCGHPALVLEQTPRHINPSPDWASVPVIYVLTGTTLLQSSARTGHERTLTTTSIIRPWAYVGLSEDIVERLRDHRAKKDEWRRALFIRSGTTTPFSSDDIRYLELAVHSLLEGSGEVRLDQATPRGNASARPRYPDVLDEQAKVVVAVLRLTGTLI